jgi:hypothetical protein
MSQAVGVCSQESPSVGTTVPIGPRVQHPRAGFSGMFARRDAYMGKPRSNSIRQTNSSWLMKPRR